MGPKRKLQEDRQPSRQPKRSKRIQQRGTPQSKPEHEEQQPQGKRKNTPQSILGGLKDPTLDSRVSTSDSSSGSVFSVPFKDGKHIICERHHGDKQDGRSQPKLIFTHGAGGGLANPATRLFAEGFGTLAPVVCMQGTMNLKSRVDTFEAIIAHERRRGQVGDLRALGGRSMGARAAAIAATEDHQGGRGRAGPLALVLASYPLISGGKKGKGEVRDQILYDLPSGTGVLFIVGSGDVQCPLSQLKGVMKKMDGKEVWLVEVQGADHSMALKPKEAVEHIRRRSGEIAARWVQDWEYLEDRHVVLRWDGEKETCILRKVVES